MQLFGKLNYDKSAHQFCERLSKVIFHVHQTILLNVIDILNRN